MAIAPTTFGLPASSRSGRSAQAMESVVTAWTVPPPAWSGAGPNADRAPTRAPVPYGAYILWADRATKSRWPGSSWGRMSIGRCGASWAASTRIRPPAAWTFSANSCTGCTTPVTFDAPDTASSATRPACSARQPIEILDVQRTVRAETDVHRAEAPSPRQVVRVVFEHRRQHHRIVFDGQRAGEPVDRLGRVLGEHDDVAFGVGTEELADQLAAHARTRSCSRVTCSQFPDGRPNRTEGTPRSSRPPI